MASAASPPLSPTPRTTVRRRAERAQADRALLHEILDEGLICHVGIATEDGPVVIPTGYCRIGETLYLHGSPASRLLRDLARGVDCCVTVTLLDGMVMARSAFHHSMNYRSAVVMGRATSVDDLAERARALDGFVDHMLPGRSGECRPADETELRGTLVLAVPLDEASVKVRTGPPVDDEEDVAGPWWAGVLPVGVAVGAAVGSPDLRGDEPRPASLTTFADRHTHPPGGPR
jgi:nitroimidazol reductase NimA-like FMN-containing flavoprotein (pyridoxamine 5'-phosphate oxidase superfamily)